MESSNLYQDIAKRTDGDIYVGVVGPVRTGKSTFIKNFMDLLVIPNIDNEYKKERAKDELPQSAGGRTIMTTEPKFVPNEAIEITLDDNLKFKTRLVDCVGYLVDNAIGYLEDDMPRMVKTPWSDEEIPFETAAEIGTKKVIEEHSTIGILVTTDGTVTDIPREDYIKAEERVVSELKALNKPFIILLNSETPSSDYTQELAQKLTDGMQIQVSSKTPVNNSNEQVNDTNSNIPSNNNSSSNLININTATKEDLDTLPGIGPATAQKIIDYRQEHGNFSSIEDIKNVKGIGEAKFSKMQDKICT